MALSDLLQRLRPIGAPGAAGPVAVPAEVEGAAAAELAPVFEALEPVLAEYEAIRSDAERAAAEEAVRAHREANALVADASSRAASERAAAAARIHRSGDAAADELLAETEATAARLRVESEPRLQELTRLVVANLRASIAGGGGSPGLDR